MSIIAPFLKQIVSTISSVSEDKHGTKTPTTVYSNVRCRWENKINQVLTATGEVVETSTEMWVTSAYTILEDYKVVKNSKTYVVIAVYEGYNLVGQLDYYRAFLKG